MALRNDLLKFLEEKKIPLYQVIEILEQAEKENLLNDLFPPLNGRKAKKKAVIKQYESR